MNDLQKRKSNRLKEYDYSQNGAYFITMCIKDRHEMLWKNQNPNSNVISGNFVGERIARPFDTTILSEYGIAVNDAIQSISKHYGCVFVNKYVIMPNHVHLIMTICGDTNGRAMRAPYN